MQYVQSMRAKHSWSRLRFIIAYTKWSAKTNQMYAHTWRCLGKCRSSSLPWMQDSLRTTSDNALVTTQDKGKWQCGSGNSSSNPKTMCPDIECWNCGKKGHVQPDCQSKKKEQNADKKDGTSANATMEGSEWVFTATLTGRHLQRMSHIKDKKLMFMTLLHQPTCLQTTGLFLLRRFHYSLL